jgi:putative hydroxymethylpyrimidine transport system permease protein
MMLSRLVVVCAGFAVLWQVLVLATGVPAYILPGPWQVVSTFVHEFEFIFGHALTTIAEILSGLVIGCLLGMASAVLMARYAPLKHWMLPVMVMSQAVLASKVVMAVLIIYFPVAAAFYDGLRRAEPGWLDLARTMGASPGAELRFVRLPAALPALASGIRVATAVAPIGAVVGEWVGSSAGLGYLMLHANARMQVDLMFAALLFLALFAVLLYSLIDAGLRHLTHWQPDTGLGGQT